MVQEQRRIRVTGRQRNPLNLGLLAQVVLMVAAERVDPEEQSRSARRGRQDDPPRGAVTVQRRVLDGVRSDEK